MLHRSFSVPLVVCCAGLPLATFQVSGWGGIAWLVLATVFLVGVVAAAMLLALFPRRTRRGVQLALALVAVECVIAPVSAYAGRALFVQHIKRTLPEYRGVVDRLRSEKQRGRFRPVLQSPHPDVA